MVYVTWAQCIHMYMCVCVYVYILITITTHDQENV